MAELALSPFALIVSAFANASMTKSLDKWRDTKVTMTRSVASILRWWQILMSNPAQLLVVKPYLMYSIGAELNAATISSSWYEPSLRFSWFTSGSCLISSWILSTKLSSPLVGNKSKNRSGHSHPFKEKNLRRTWPKNQDGTPNFQKLQVQWLLWYHG